MRVKDRNRMKKQYMKPLQELCAKLEQENELLKTNPETAIGQLILQMRELSSQNQRLTTLAATLIKVSGDKVTLSREEMESFKGQRIQISIDVADEFKGLKNEDGSLMTEEQQFAEAKEFVFTYKVIQANEPVAETAPPEAPSCTDPDCTLPKDLKHTHTVPVPDAGETDATEPGDGMAELVQVSGELTD